MADEQDVADVIDTAAADPAPTSEAAPDPKAPPAGDKPSASIASGEPAKGAADKVDGDAEKVEPDFPADWRDKMAKGDPELLKVLKKFASPGNVAKAFVDTKDKLSKGASALMTLPDDATDEQKAEWRKARDIPDNVDGYDVALKGIDWTDGDKQDIGSFAKEMHAINAPRSVVKQALQWYANTTIAKQQEVAAAAERNQKQTVTELKKEFGADYDRNISLMLSFGQEKLGEQGWTSLVNSRLADGTHLGDNPAFIKLIVDNALEYGDGLPIETGGASGGVTDADLIKSHKDLSAKAASGDREAKSKMNDADYAKRIDAAYERQAKRAERKSA